MAADVHRRMEERADRRLAREHRKESKLNALSALKTAVTGQKPSTLSVAMPSPIAASDLTESLGELRGTRWYYSKRFNAELAEHARTYSRTEILPDLPILETDDGWRAFAMHAPGTFEHLSAVATRRERPRPAHRLVDLVALQWLADRVPERVFAPVPAGSTINPLTRGARPLVKDPEPPARGPEAIIARLAASGADVRLAADGRHLVVSSKLGRPSAGVVELVTASGRLLVGWLRGEPVTCEVEAHKKPIPATTLVLGGAAACDECLYRLAPEEPVRGAA